MPGYKCRGETVNAEGRIQHEPEIILDDPEEHQASQAAGLNTQREAVEKHLRKNSLRLGKPDAARSVLDIVLAGGAGVSPA